MKIKEYEEKLTDKQKLRLLQRHNNGEMRQHITKKLNSKSFNQKEKKILLKCIEDLKSNMS